MQAKTPTSDDPFAGLDDELEATIKSPLKSAEPPANYKPQDFSEPCPKCRGRGQFVGYSGRVLGPCFACKGAGKRTFKTPADQRARSRATAAAREAKKAEAKAAEIAAQVEAWKADHPDVWSWMDGSIFEFAVSMREALERWGSLTDKQIAACHRCIGKLNAAKVAAAERVETAKTIDMSKIEAAFARAGASLKFPKLRVAGFSIYPAGAASKNAGSLYVRGLAADKSEDVYLGKIAGGKFIRSRDCSAEQEAKILEVAADPQAAAVAYGKLTGSCACCGRHLENAESVARGIGPICAEKFGW